MNIKAYLLIALVGFIAAVTGSDLFARMTIAGEGFGFAVAEHLRWASLTIVGLVLLFVPFGGVALICGGANKRAKTRSFAVVFFIAMAILGYFYFEGFQAAQHALLQNKWTAATLSVGLLPFFIGLPLLAVVAIAAAIVTQVDRQSPA
ncbi:MAG TPA: hypothetical protein VHG29_04030 [Novosphingobium sp.]|nr:hypothetical protein [Novosphingobium sp.]